MSFLSRIFGSRTDRDRALPLYRAIVKKGRDPAWYRDGGVPDTLDGRFDMIAAVLALVLIRLESEGEEARAESVLLTEIFIDDMDGTLRQIGVGDLMVGKHLGKMMGALGGRLAAFRAALAAGDLTAPVARNIFHDAKPSEASVAFVAGRLGAFAERLRQLPAKHLLAGELPLP